MIYSGIYYDIPNEAYHAGPGVSKSQRYRRYTSNITLAQKCPVDTEKTKHLDTGTAFHCRVLERKNSVNASSSHRSLTAVPVQERRKPFWKSAPGQKNRNTRQKAGKSNLCTRGVMALPLGQWLVKARAGYAEIIQSTGKIRKQEFCVGAVPDKII